MKRSLVLVFLIVIGVALPAVYAKEAILRSTACQAQTAPPKKAPKVSPKLDVIVLDAGHGGKDAGAIGPGGYMEKKATLGIVLKLGKLLEEELPNVKIVYTRASDVFIPLYRRGQIANENSGKLFISIHCNSTPQKPSKASGFTTYILRPGKTDAAINVAARENAVIKYESKKDQHRYLTDEDFILTSMARSQDVRYSEKFAALTQDALSDQLDISDNGVSQAGFFVLVGASMPNVLIETGFISNPSEEKLLKSESGQMKYARGILNAILKYKKEYEKS